MHAIHHLALTYNRCPLAHPCPKELEKFRFVLDYKIKELKLQIAPRENEITTMRKQIEEMHLELEQYHKSNQALTLMIEELKLKMEVRRDVRIGSVILLHLVIIHTLRVSPAGHSIGV
ncbi:hypothetical protein EON64_12910 [archaeon]|nr:MAG: hypothetical protein EON64_12910 [archaeon]